MNFAPQTFDEVANELALGTKQYFITLVLGREILLIQSLSAFSR